MEEELNVPLTRRKGHKLEEISPPLATAIAPIAPIAPIALTPPIEITTKSVNYPAKPKKPRAPKTPAQLLAFQKAMETRKKNIEQKKLEKKVEASKILLAHEEKQRVEPIIETKPKPRSRPKKQIIKEIVEESSDDEPEIVYVKRRKSKKKIIVQSESETESEPEIEIKHRQSFGTSHQNKSSVKGITKMEPIKKSYHNFFAD